MPDALCLNMRWVSACRRVSYGCRARVKSARTNALYLQTNLFADTAFVRYWVATCHA